MSLEILFDILSFSATTWQFFVTLLDSLRCVLYWDHLMIPPKKLLEIFLRGNGLQYIAVHRLSLRLNPHC